MKVNLIIFALLAFVYQSKAQFEQLVAGKKLVITQESNLSNSSNMMGQNIEALINNTVTINVEIKSKKDSTIVLTSTIKRIKGKLSVMGQDNTFDSDDSSTTNNPMLGDALKDVNKPQNFIVVNGKVKQSGGGMNDDMPSLTQNLNINSSSIIAELFVPSEAKNKKEGFKWTTDEESADSTQKAISIFTVTKADKQNTEITANTTMSLKGKSKMMGMDVNQNLTGSRSSIMTYMGGVLSKSNQNVTMSGTADVMGNSMPLNSKGVITITVQ